MCLCIIAERTVEFHFNCVNPPANLNQLKRQAGEAKSVSSRNRSIGGEINNHCLISVTFVLYSFKFDKLRIIILRKMIIRMILL